MRSTDKTLSYKRNRERDIGGGRHFKLLSRIGLSWFWCTTVLYITYTLMEFLFGLDQSNVCRDIEKIERLIRQFTHSSETVQGNQEVENQRRC